MARVEKFRERMERLWSSWSDDTTGRFQDAEAFAVATGVYEEDADIGYLKSFALVTWLFGAELQGCAVLASKEKVVIILGASDYKGLQSCASGAKDGLPEIAVIAAEDEAKRKTAVSGILADVKKVGFLQKEVNAQNGPIAEHVNGEVGKVGSKVNIAAALAQILAPKDKDELSKLKKAAVLTTTVIRRELIARIEKYVDEERKVTHTQLAELTEDAISNPDKVRLSNLKPEFCDPCYPPIIQSNDAKAKRKFDLRPSAESSEEQLRPGCIVLSVGARYNFYCSNTSRTLLMYPSEQQEKVYNIVLKAQEKAIAALVPGEPLKNVYLAAKSYLKAACDKDSALPDLAGNLTKNVGFGMGIEFRDSSLVLNTKNETQAMPSMVFNVAVGVQNIQDKKKGTYSVMLADTVVVNVKGTAPEVYTSTSKKEFKQISYVENDEDEDAVEVVDMRKKRRSNGEVENGTENRGRSRRRAAVDLTQSQNVEEALKQKKHQEELAEKMLKKGLAKFAGSKPLNEEEESEKKKKQLDEFRAYSAAKHFPSLRPRIITVDMQNEAIIVPINGVPVPFHISVIKSVSKSDEGQHSYLRINFFTPMNPTVGRRAPSLRVSDNNPVFPEVKNDGNCKASYIKELSFRSSNPTNLGDAMRKIKELRKRATQAATQAKEMQSLVAQQSLVLERRGRVPVLHDVQVRPAPVKKTARGSLEAHQNGFRFRSKAAQLDIIYANIRNAFFQPAENQVIVILHFHLKNEIMVGKKKTKDVQFYVQVVEAAVRLNDKRRRQFDQDELEEEQRERDLRNRTNKSFSRFHKEVTERYGIEFDVPYRELAFEGAPRSSSVTLVPTVSCIVDLVETPAFVLNLEDVEIAHFERVSFQLRMFDLVFVLKGFEEDFTKKGKTVKDMWLRISSIKVEELVPLKDYLDRQNIKFYEGPANLQWNEVLRNIRKDLEAFYEAGGWNFLSLEDTHANDDDEEANDDDDDKDGDGDFKLDSDDEARADESSEEDYSDSDASGALDELGGDSDAGEDELSSDEEGKDWRELEKEAEAFDRRKGRAGSDDEGGRKRTAGRKRRR